MFVVIKNKIIESRFLKDSIWALVGNIVYRGASLLSTIFLAQILLKNLYGEYNSLKNTLTTLAIFTTFGLGYTSTKFFAQCLSGNNHPQYLIKRIYFISLSFSFIISFLLFLFANQVSIFYYNSFEFALEIRLLSFWLILMALTTVQNGIISGLKIYKQLTRINVFIGIITLFLTPLLGYFFSVIGACISLIIIQTFNCFSYYVIIKKKLNEIENDYSDYNIKYSNIIVYSLPLTLIEAIFSFALWINYYLIQHNYNYGEVALYSTAMQWYVLLLFIPMILKNVMLSYFSGNNEDDTNIFKKGILLSFTSALIPAIVIFLFSYFIEDLYGISFKGLSVLFKIISIIAVFSSMIGVVEQYLFSLSKNWIVFFICLIKDGGTCLLFYYFIMFSKVHEASYYLLLSYLILNIFSFIAYILVMYIFKRNNN